MTFLNTCFANHHFIITSVMPGLPGDGSLYPQPPCNPKCDKVLMVALAL